MNPDLIAKLEKQEALLKANYGPAATATDGFKPSSIPVDEAPFVPVMDSVQNQAAAQARSTYTPEKTQMQPPVAQTPAAPEVSSVQSLRDRIEQAERAIGSSGSMTGASSHKEFLDEYGNETFYVKNISNGHVAISDMENVAIKRNESLDLLKVADITEIRKSRDLRTALQVTAGKQWLKRLTPEEYLRELNTAYNNKVLVDKLKSVNQPQEDTSNKIRPMVSSKLEKLYLGTKPDTVHLGLTSIEFIEWALSENLSHAELEYIIGSVTDIDIKKPLMQKKAQLGSGLL